MTKIAVFGAGTWGIALARLLAANGRDVTVWSAIPAELKSLSTTHRHPNLPGMELPAAMHYTADIAEACTGRDILLFAVPSPFVRATAKKAAPHIPEGQLIVDVAKGVEDKTLMTMSEIIEDELAKAGRKARVVALSGPTHAEEVARDMPTAIVVDLFFGSVTIWIQSISTCFFKICLYKFLKNGRMSPFHIVTGKR